MASWLAGRTVLLTGASEGIGAAMAPILAQRCGRLILTSRRQDRLDKVASPLSCPVRSIAADLSHPAGLDHLLEALEAERVDVLVNNAGAGLGGPFCNREPEELAAMLQLNITSLVMLTRRLLVPMLERREGAVLNVGSMAGFVGVPWLSAYSASKAFVNNFSEGLRTELHGSGVRVCLLAPGTTRTGFFRSAGIAEEKLHRSGQDPEVVARLAVEAIEKDARLAIPGLVNRWQYLALKVVPRSVVLPIARWIFRGAREAPHR